MPSYVFRCDVCAEFTVRQSMSQLRPTHRCACGRDSPRVYTAPALLATPSGLSRGIEAAAASAESPQVVRSIPAGRPRPSAGRWSPYTGGPPVNAARRPAGPHQALPRW